MRQHPRPLPLGLPLEGRGAARRRAPDADQDHAGALPSARAGVARRTSLRTSRDHRGPNRARTARLPRLGGRRDHGVKRFLGLLIVLLACGPAAAQLFKKSPDELLEPEKAFRFSARPAQGGVDVTFAIADGYYMYRDKFRFSAEGNPAVKLGPPQFPAGARHKDEFFGEVETYRRQVRIHVPAHGEGRFDLKVVSQGCADIGVCYVPMESRAELRLAAADAPGTFVSQGPKQVDAEPRWSIFASDIDIARLFEGNAALVLASFFGFGLLLSF